MHHPRGNGLIVAATENIFRRNYRSKRSISGLDLFSSEAHADTGTQSQRLPKIENKLWRFIMTKLLLSALLIASALAAPSFAFAQDNNVPVTRAEVRAQLTQLEQAGYNQATNDNYYPQALQAAQQRVNASNGVTAESYGPSNSGTSASGIRTSIAPASGNDQHSIYFGH
ncbi:MAG: hypothetical protein CBARDMAM_4388 [uncultured Caballeronia sp.]|nr:MAG: hypothetical protein CBARDMAM_4388 [uncultured Caballeronia sp.]